jgi:hypothetical protein
VEKNCKETFFVTPRASYNGAALLANGVDCESVTQSLLFTDCSEATKQSIISNVGGFSL